MLNLTDEQKRILYEVFDKIRDEAFTKSKEMKGDENCGFWYYLGAEKVTRSILEELKWK